MDVKALYKAVRLSGALHAILGVFLLAIAIVDRVVITEHTSSFPAKYALGIWIGSWVIFTGVFGIIISLRCDASKPNAMKKSEVKVYLVSTIISIVLTITLITCYSVSIGLMAGKESFCNKCPTNSTSCTQGQCSLQITLGAVEMYESVLELCVAVWTLLKCRFHEANVYKDAQDPKPKEKENRTKNKKDEEKSKKKSPRAHFNFGQKESPKESPKDSRRMTLLELSRTANQTKTEDQRL